MSFFESPQFLLTSESVTEGHPDKVCDQISDAVLDLCLQQDSLSHVACETSTTRGLVVVMGEITSRGHVPFDEVVRETLRKIGYTKAEHGIGYDTCAVMVSVQKQATEIAQAVHDVKSSDREAVGAGDQGMMVGFACQESVDSSSLDTEFMPLPIYLAHRLGQRLALVRKEGVLPYLRPDGKTQVTVEYSQGTVKRIHTVVVSAQHAPEVSQARLHSDIMEQVIVPVIPSFLLDSRTVYHINPSGSFVVGGPMSDTGLTGRKILVDTYGSLARHGGGAFSGKDPTKVDRSGAYGARHVAKNVVAAGLASRCEVQVSYAIGIAKPLAISVETFGTGRVPDETITALVEKHFDLRPLGIIEDLDLRRPIYQQTAAYGHFGRNDLDLPWERTDRVKLLRLPQPASAAVRPPR
ncbi:MAG: methionine adenosyltransferase [Chloroflexi bacterium]|nr:methionine adenosyltransferase [Chloroflexota bacterium]